MMQIEYQDNRDLGDTEIDTYFERAVVSDERGIICRITAGDVPRAKWVYDFARPATLAELEFCIASTK